MDFSDDSYSFEIQPTKERKKNLKEIEKWIRSLKLQQLNQHLLKDPIFSTLYVECTKAPTKVQEIDEMKEIMTCLFSQFIKYEVKEIRQKRIPIKVEAAEDEIVVNKDLLVEIKQKLHFLWMKQIPLPFILNFIDVKTRAKEPKLTVTCEQALLDCLNFTIVMREYTEDQVKKEAKNKGELKMKELLKLVLEVLYENRKTVENELVEMFFDLRASKNYLLKKIDQLKENKPTLEENSQISLQLVTDLLQFCKMKQEASQINQSSLMPRKNGLRWISKILFQFCYISQLCFPEILIYIRMRGKLERNQQKLKRPTVVQFAKKLDFLRKMYNIPEIKKQCWNNKLVPMDQSKRTPSYLLEQHNLHLHNLYKDLFRDLLYLENMQDYVLETQLKLLITRYESLKLQIMEGFNDLRFQQNWSLIYNLYEKYIKAYDGNLDSLKQYDSLKWSKDIIVSCLLKHIQFLINQENLMKSESQIIKFHFDSSIRYKVELREQAASNTFTKFFYIKIFICDLVALDQPFTHLFKFMAVYNDKLESSTKYQLLGQFLYNEKIQNFFAKKYHLKIETSQQDDSTVVFTNIPITFDDITREYSLVSWDMVIMAQIKIIYKYRGYLRNEIIAMMKTKEFQNYKSKLNEKSKIYEETTQLFNKLELEFL